MEQQEEASVVSKNYPSIGDRMESYESTPRVPPFQTFIVRADGNRFSKYTQGLHKPFDVVFQRAMVRTANGMLNHFHALTVFVCSDEISLVFGPVCSEDEYKMAEASGETNLPTHLFSGRFNKIETLVSSKCSVLFNKFMAEEVRMKLDEDPGYYTKAFAEKVESRDAIFDARMVPFPLGSENEIVNNIIWRSCYDCHRNTVASYARHVLGKTKCQYKNSEQMIALMKETTNFDFIRDVSMADKYGVFCKKITREFTNDEGEKYTRYRDYNFCTNLMAQDRDKSLELFMMKYFEDALIQFEEYNL